MLNIKSATLFLLLSACGGDPGLDTPETQGEACDIVAQVTCDVAVDCSSRDNLSDYDACVDHATEHCLMHHEAGPNDPPEGWDACAEKLEDFSCKTDAYQACFYPDFRP